MTASSSLKSKRDKTGWWVLAAFLGFFAVFCTVDAIFVTVALRSHTGTVTEHAYEKGLAYNQTLETADRNDTEFKGTITVTGDTLIWSIARVNGGAWTPDTVEATFVRSVSQGHDFTRALTPDGKGAYALLLDAPLKGAWTIRLTARDQDGKVYDAVTDVVLK